MTMTLPSDRPAASFKARPYQVDAIEGCLDKLGRHRSSLLVLPTGTGKTIVFAEVAHRWRTSGRGRTLVLAHREELIDQARDKIEGFTGLHCEVEMGDRRARGDYDVLIASVQTMSRESRRSAFAANDVSLVVIDEAHHATADSYKSVTDYFSGAKVLGVTATPDRADGAAMRAAFESVAHIYEIRDAIQDGWLVPIRQRTVVVEGLDLSGVRTTAGDLNQGDLERALKQDRVLHEMAAPTIELAENRPTIVFTSTVAHAMDLAAVLNGYKSGCAVAACGTTESSVRRDVVDRFMRRDVQFLVNCALFTEGFDAPLCACVAVARPTKSRAFYAQMVGRGTRILGASYTESCANGKRDLLVLDLTAKNAGKHSLVNCADILDGNKDAQVRERALRIQRDHPERDMLRALDEADDQIAKERHAAVIAKARMRVQDVDPFALLGASSRAGRWGGVEVTEKQAAFLAKNKIEVAKLDRGQASALIGKIIERSSNNLCTYKQATTLLKFGLNPDVSFDDARKALDAIAGNGWKVPETLRARMGVQP